MKTQTDNQRNRHRGLLHKQQAQYVSRLHSRHNSGQKGAVMITVLMLLVVITLMGLSSMKQGLFQARLGASTVSYNTCFMEAESGINAVFRAFQAEYPARPIQNADNFMNQASSQHVKHCLGTAGLELRPGTSCDSLTEYQDGDVQVAIVSRPADLNNQMEKDNLATFEFDIDKGAVMLIYTDSRCEMPGMDMAVTNTQAWQHRASNSLPKHNNTNI